MISERLQRARKAAVVSLRALVQQSELSHATSANSFIDNLRGKTRKSNAQKNSLIIFSR